ncbi:hypothetical protein ACOSP7_000741 [Xanthoceras sorbifolium]
MASTVAPYSIFLKAQISVNKSKHQTTREEQQTSITTTLLIRRRVVRRTTLLRVFVLAAAGVFFLALSNDRAAPWRRWSLLRPSVEPLHRSIGKPSGSFNIMKFFLENHQENNMEKNSR